MGELPTGTVTFLFTDLEGSTRLWEDHPEAMQRALARHDAILREAIESHCGQVVKTTGDGVHAVFETGHEALAAAQAGQTVLREEEWGPTGSLRVRMGVHSGEAERRDGDYFGPALNRAARLVAIGHGGQVLVSDATFGITRDRLPKDTALVDLGEHRLRDLTERVRVFQLVHPELERDFPPLRSLDVLPGNLPLQPTELVGREVELGDLTAMLRSLRLLTLTGVGGVGKTRLAVQVAAEVLPRYRDGAWFCELGPVTDQAVVPDAVADALSVQARAGQTITDTLVDYLRAKELLLVLDNCEHLLDAVARFVERVERECRGITVLATSREGLALRGEHIVAVPSLAADAAARLFSDRAAEVRTGFSSSGEHQVPVRELCERLDGIPLAIELAAARLRSMTVSELLERLDQRFRLLTGGSRTALERHQTLRATVDWSYELLSSEERAVLNRLAVFARGFNLDAAEAVVAGDGIDRVDVLDRLGLLVDKSLVIADEAAGATRYRLLETIRQYAQEQLEHAGEADRVRRRHAEHYVALVEAAAPGLRSRGQLAWLARLAPDLDNLRAVMTWSAGANEADLALRLVVATNVNGVQISHTALGWAEAAAEIPSARDHPMYSDVLGWAAWGAVYRADLDRAGELVGRMHDAERQLGVAPAAARCQGPATLAMFRGQWEAAIQQAQRWVELARAGRDDYELVQALTMLGSAYQLTRPDLVVPTLEEAVEIGRRVGAPGILSWALTALGSFSEVDPERLFPILAEGVEIGTLAGNHYAVAHARLMTAWIERERGEPTAALRATCAAWEYAHQVGARLTVAQALFVTTLLLAEIGDFESAAILSGYTDAVIDNWGNWGSAHGDLRAAMQAALRPERLEDLQRRGARLTDEQAIELARSAVEGVLSG